MSGKGKAKAGPSEKQEAASPGAPLASEQAIIGRWQSLRQEINALYSRITELEMELAEHRLVISAIEPMDASRRCFRMVGGVLVERTVGEVLPAVRRNRDGLEEVLSRFADGLAKKKVELSELEKKYNIRIRSVDEVGRAGEGKAGGGGRGGGSGGGVASGAGPSSASQGVLVGQS